ncbi:MAG: hypothetical protein MUF49_20210 [Oculatellaceae cyanobacterium Prado106]|nr:hypothetical protein [Oculatellaceae cyanobacterium Prado106]
MLTAIAGWGDRASAQPTAPSAFETANILHVQKQPATTTWVPLVRDANDNALLIEPTSIFSEVHQQQNFVSFTMRIEMPPENTAAVMTVGAHCDSKTFATFTEDFYQWDTGTLINSYRYTPETAVYKQAAPGSPIERAIAYACG